MWRLPFSFLYLKHILSGRPNLVSLPFVFYELGEPMSIGIYVYFHYASQNKKENFCCMIFGKKT